MKKALLFILSVFMMTNSLVAQGNQCLDFDGNNDFIQINDSELGDDFTLSFWFQCKATSLATFDERLFSLGPNNRLEIGIQSGTDKLWIFEGSVGSPRSYGQSLRDGAWHQLTYIKSGAQRTVYIDSEIITEYQATTTVVYGPFSRIGAWTGGTTTDTYFNGRIDELRIWSTAQSEEQLEDSRMCPLTGEEPNLIAYYNFDQGISDGNNSDETSLIDQSGNQIDGVLANFQLNGTESNWIDSDNETLEYINTSIVRIGDELTAEGEGLTYQWLSCSDDLSPISDAIEQSYTPTESGDYALQVSNGSCTRISDCITFILGNSIDNSCLDFDGNDDFVQFSDLSLEDDFTISLWFKCKGNSMATFDERIFSLGPTTRLEIGIEQGSNRLWLFDGPTGSPKQYGNDLRDGEWHHVAYVKSTSEREFYLDGELIDSYQASTVANYGPFSRLGAWTGGSDTDTRFHGQIDEASLWSTAKTSDELDDIRSCSLESNQDDLYAYWSFDQGTPNGQNENETSVLDQSGNSRNGSLSNFQLIGNTSNWINSDNFLFQNLDASVSLDNSVLSATASGLSYQWLDCSEDLSPINGANQQTYTPTSSGSYALEVSNGSCTRISDCIEVVLLDTKEPTRSINWLAYPNPATDYLTIEVEKFNSGKVIINDIHGRLLLSRPIKESKIKIDISHIVPGIFFVTIQQGNISHVEKHIKI